MKLSSSLICFFAVLPLAGCDQSKPHQPTTEVNGPTSQRYQIVFSPHVRADTYLLDTEKGRVWQMTQFTGLKGSPIAWAEMGVIDEKSEIGVPIAQYISIYKKDNEVWSQNKVVS